MSLSMISEFYNKINIPKFKEILDNIIYLGLPNYKLINKKELRKNTRKEMKI